MDTEPAPCFYTAPPLSGEPSPATVMALPALEHLTAELYRIVGYARSRGDDESPCGFAQVGWMIASALSNLCKAIRHSDKGKDPDKMDATLNDLADDLVNATADANETRAAATSLPDLLANENHARIADEVHDFIVHRLTAHAVPHPDAILEGLDGDEQIDIVLDLATGAITWHSRHLGVLPVNGRTLLDLALVLDGLGHVHQRIWDAETRP